MMGQMPGTSIQFARACRALAGAARQAGLVVPSFRSPPRLDGAVRTVRRRDPLPPVIAVTHQGRPFNAVLADLVEGVVVVNALEGAEALRARSALWESLATQQVSPAA